MDFQDTFLKADLSLSNPSPARPARSARPARPACRFSNQLVPYDMALSFMETRAKEIREGTAEELLWFLEHPPLYTAGTSAKPEDLLEANKFPVFKTNRGGEYTYHGPGQRVVYLMLDLKQRGADIKCFVRNIEQWIITALAAFNIEAKTSKGRVGVWIPRPDIASDIASDIAPEREDKIGAIGIRVRRWVSFHGLSINVDPDLQHFSSIIPCGITAHGVTSMVDLGYPVTMAELDKALLDNFTTCFTAPPIASDQDGLSAPK